jgi:hypothetical protein
VNRVWWNLTSDLTKQAKLRTSPLFSPDLRFSPDGKVAPGIGRFGMLALPGVYTVKIRAAGQELSQQLTVRKDPNSGGSEQEIRAQTIVVASLVTDVNSAVDMINALEVVRSQLASIKSTLGDDSTKKDVRASTDSIDQKLTDVEEQLFQMRVTGRGQDLLRWPMKVTEQLLYLANSVSGSDNAPTDQQQEVQGVLETQLRAVRAQYDQVMSKDLEAFKQMLRQRNIQNVIISN